MALQPLFAEFYKHYNSLINAGGGHSQGSTFIYYEDVLEYDEQKMEWNNIGSMSIKRSAHAITVVNYNSIKDYCN